MCEQYHPEEQLGIAEENRLMNIEFGLSDYGRMRLLLQLNKLYKQEKMLRVS
jgi:hypothetical protein